MPIYGATVYVRFDGEDQRIKNMMDTAHEHYHVLPQEVVALKEELREAFKWIIPIDFRYFYALAEFELMGVLVTYEDAIECVLTLEGKLKELQYKVMITAGFGEVVLPKNHKEMKPITILNQMVGHGVYSAFEYFKMKKKGVLKKEYSYYFYSYHSKFRHFNVQRKTLIKRKETLKKELHLLQTEDVRTQRHTYYRKAEC